MISNQKIVRSLLWLAVAFTQLISTQVVTFLVSLLLPGMEDFPQTHSALFVLVLGITYSTGVFLVGWLALKLGWLKTKPRLASRLAGMLIGVYLPLVIALFLYRTLEPGNPFFFIAMLTCVLGFHLPGWFQRSPGK